MSSSERDLAVEVGRWQGLPILSPHRRLELIPPDVQRQATFERERKKDIQEQAKRGNHKHKDPGRCHAHTSGGWTRLVVYIDIAV
jgi:hypothetical protein